MLLSVMFVVTVVGLVSRYRDEKKKPLSQ
jgi:hypothetical protein